MPGQTLVINSLVATNAAAASDSFGMEAHLKWCEQVACLLVEKT